MQQGVRYKLINLVFKKWLQLKKCKIGYNFNKITVASRQGEIYKVTKGKFRGQKVQINQGRKNKDDRKEDRRDLK